MCASMGVCVSARDECTHVWGYLQERTLRAPRLRASHKTRKEKEKTTSYL